MRSFGVRRLDAAFKLSEALEGDFHRRWEAMVDRPSQTKAQSSLRTPRMLCIKRKSRALAALLKYNNKGTHENNFIDGDDFDFGHVSLECGTPR